ncbi:MAG: hypothetical protein AAF266_15830, partial [Planctomycetota bacterium]
ELSDQLDALVAMPPEEQPAALEAIASETLTAPLSDARISGSIDEIDIGRRITLTLAWPMADRKRPSITLVGWSMNASPQKEYQQ